MSGVESISKIIIILMNIGHFYEHIDPLFSVYMKPHKTGFRIDDIKSVKSRKIIGYMHGVESISKIIIILKHLTLFYIDQLFSVYMKDMKHRRFSGFSKEEWSLFMASNTSILMAS